MQIYFSTKSIALAGDSFTPGPIVDARVTDFMYLPLADAGFALATAVIRLAMFSASFSLPNDTFPVGT